MSPVLPSSMIHVALPRIAPGNPTVAISCNDCTVLIMLPGSRALLTKLIDGDRTGKILIVTDVLAVLVRSLTCRLTESTALALPSSATNNRRIEDAEAVKVVSLNTLAHESDRIGATCTQDQAKLRPEAVFVSVSLLPDPSNSNNCNTRTDFSALPATDATKLPDSTITTEEADAAFPEVAVAVRVNVYTFPTCSNCGETRKLNGFREVDRQDKGNPPSVTDHDIADKELPFSLSAVLPHDATLAAPVIETPLFEVVVIKLLPAIVTVGTAVFRTETDVVALLHTPKKLHNFTVNE